MASSLVLIELSLKGSLVALEDLLCLSLILFEALRDGAEDMINEKCGKIILNLKLLEYKQMSLRNIKDSMMLLATNNKYLSSSNFRRTRFDCNLVIWTKSKKYFLRNLWIEIKLEDRKSDMYFKRLANKE